MKTFLLFLLACTASFAQDFTLTQTGKLVSKKDTKVDYIILHSPGITADTLYASAKKYIETKSSDSQIAIKSEDAGKVLIYETSNAPMSASGDVNYTASFTTSLEFKDGKARITYGNINMYTTSTNAEKTNYPLTSIYNSKGKVTDQKAKNLIESYFSAYTKTLITALKSDGKIVSADW